MSALRWSTLAAFVVAVATPALAQVSGAVPRPSPRPTPKPASRKPPAKPAAAPRFSLDIEQDGAPVPIVDGEVYLRRGPFTLLVESPQADSVYLRASHDRSEYDVARRGDAVSSFRTAQIIAERTGNADKMLDVRPGSLHVLRVVDPGHVNLDQWTKVGAGFRGRRTVTRYLVGSDEATLAPIALRPVYLVLVRGTWDDSGAITPVETRAVALFFDTLPKATRQRLEPHVKTLHDKGRPVAERVAALQELARSGRDAILVMDGSGGGGSELMPQETTARQQLQSVVAAQRTWAATNAGLFDTPSCLQQPRSCGSKNAPVLQQPFEGEADGYRRAFHAGTGLSRDEAKKLKASATSLRNFAVTAVPVEAASGLRGLCADDTGRVCAVDDPAQLDAEEGRCPAGCQDLK